MTNRKKTYRGEGVDWEYIETISSMKINADETSLILGQRIRVACDAIMDLRDRIEAQESRTLICSPDLQTRVDEFVAWAKERAKQDCSGPYAEIEIVLAKLSDLGLIKKGD